MKPISVTGVYTLVCTLFFSLITQAQTIGTTASAVWLTDCNQSNYFNTSGTALLQIGPSGNAFNNANLGLHTQNSGTLVFRGGEVRSFKTPGIANVCGANIHYRIYLQSGTPGSFTAVDLSFTDNCSIPASQFPTGGNCAAGDQKWRRVMANNSPAPYSPIDLTAFAPGNYVLEVYYSITGSSTTTSLCDETVLENNGGNNYKALFTIQNPVLGSTNPSTCNGTDGSITISGLGAGANYLISYSDDGSSVGPLNLVASAAGQLVISGLNAGIYSDFELLVNGCTTQLNTGLILTNPILIPTFNSFPAICAGSTPPTLPTTSKNGITGTWSPSVIDNQASGTYTFTPTAGLCGIAITRNITVNPLTIPNFSFGSALNICAGAAVPVLPSTSLNGITGTWSPATVDNQNSGVYNFTPSTGQCASATSFTVTVSPNTTPLFDFGTSLDICAGASVPVLPGTSSNGITGSWTPAIIDNQNSAVYNFTPSPGLCAPVTSLTVTVTPNTTPLFSFGTSLTICAGNAVPVLPNTSSNGVTGTWNPATVDNQNSGSYTFTPTAGQCATGTSLTVSVTTNSTPVFSFGTSLVICAGEAVPTLPNTSMNGISGNWSPSAIDNQNSATYNFIPVSGQCALPVSLTVTVNPVQTPAFSFGTSLSICAGGTVPSLPATSANNISGTWSPAVVDNQASATYTFTPAAGLCATSASFTVNVNANTSPVFSFGTSLVICDGGSVPTLPATSVNGITGTWSPSTISNQVSATYTFTPSSGQCATAATFSVVVNSNTTPTFSFGTTLSICAGGSVPSLPATSDNGINGSWSPASIDNQNSATYTFTPSGSQCAIATTFTVSVNANLAPVFSFGTSQTICAGANLPSLPATSNNGIAGSWNPAIADNQNSGVYTFTPTPGQCATATSFTVTVNPNTTPTFSFGNSLTICAGAAVPALPGTSSNGISGSWMPASVDNQNSGTYVFTPTAGTCAPALNFTVTVTPNVTPTFSFGTALSLCAGQTAPSLPATSGNGIAGTWSPATIDNQNSGSYTFTPSSGQCANSTTLTFTVTPNITPTFSFGTALTICQGGGFPALPSSSDNGITGTWSPSSVNNQTSAVYTFTPAAGQCASSATFTVTVNPNTLPQFGIGTALTICAGEPVPVLPNMSDNGINGIWTPSVVDNQTSAVYTFTPEVLPGQCIAPARFTVTVNPVLEPSFDFGTTINLCAGATAPILPATSANGIAGSWSPSVVNNQNSGTYTFTPAPGQCAMGAITLTVTVTTLPSLNPVSGITVNDGTGVPASNLNSGSTGVSFNWTNSNPTIGLASSGTGNLPSFTAVNQGTSPSKATITVTPMLNGCAGEPRTYVITVMPLVKDVFVPNVFTPNGDGKNELLLVYSNYIRKLEMRIFNQWGEQVELITDPKKGWDGRFKGKPQPVGVYVYSLKAEMTDGRTINLKGNITLLR
jgi:gliding motility-associated-like protein